MPTSASRRLTALRRRVARLIDPDHPTRHGAAGSTGSAPRPTRPRGRPSAADGGSERASEGGSTSASEAAPQGALVVSGAAPLTTRVGIAASDRLRHLLADEWHQIDLLPGAEPPAGLELLLLEMRGDVVVRWTDHAEDLAALVRTCAQGGVPVAVWVTVGPCSAPAWLDEVTVLAAATPLLRSELASLSGRPVELLEAAAQPRRHRPGGPPHERRGAAVLVEDSDSSAAPALEGLVGPAIKPMPAEDVTLQAVGRPGASVGALGARLGRAVEQRDWPRVEHDLASHRAVVDLSSLTGDSAWTSLAAAASATPLVGIDGTDSGLPVDVAAMVPRVHDPKQLRSELVARLEQTELVAREGLRLQRAVLASHTAAHRARTLLAHAGLPVGELAQQPSRTVSAVIPTNRTHELDNVFANLGRQAHADRELVLVLHGLDVDQADLEARAAEAGVDHLVVVEADASLTLGACMNLGVQAASGRYIAKMDDDNFYGAHFLGDLLDAFSYTDAGIVGKWCHYVWLRSSDAVVLRYPDSEHRPERRIQGGSMVFDGDVVRDLGFSDIPRAVDSDILDRAMAEGITIYSGDRFNYVSIRGTDRTAHTWTVADSTFMTKTGRLQFFGDPRPHVSV